MTANVSASRGVKFGAPLETVVGLLGKGHKLNLDVVGGGFYVSSDYYMTIAFICPRHATPGAGIGDVLKMLFPSRLLPS